MNLEKRPKLVHVVSHGPNCLDGVTAAVAVARYYRDAAVDARFSSNTNINQTLLELRCDSPDADHEVWITDISWTDPAVDRHLENLIGRGMKVYWIDHHRTALERYRSGAIRVPFTDHVLSEEFAAARLTYRFLCDRLAARPEDNPWFAALEPLVAMADDNDRWLHRIAGSRQLALTVDAMRGVDAYRELLHIDAHITYTTAMCEAHERVQAELQRSFQVAEQSRVVRRSGGPTLVAGVCEGYPSEIADAWGKTFPNAVFALFDTRSMTVSFRRSPDCAVDLSRVAHRLGGGGHAAAAGCELPELRAGLAEALAATVLRVIDETT